MNKNGQYHVRPYQAEDRAACEAIFDSNTPLYFAYEERKDFGSFLNELKVPYFVVEEDEGAIVACGGYAANKEDYTVAVLCWGMVLRDVHHRGIGRQLLAERLRRIAVESQFASVKIETSQYSRGFFERFGFIAGRIVQNGFAPGLDLVEMKLDLTQYRMECRGTRECRFP
ncbi:GNAT family N-acetyltransferase [Paenibacillus sp. 32352]|uniref:GNAT family N-acetyltransferase n=1 Tax=Paenibacillus sp. 32352 TaxID=1969111 RepID=UPI0009AD1CD8|nr:GNAT family N-acetyltransferase [Paenibacillus sp. 32352]